MDDLLNGFNESVLLLLRLALGFLMGWALGMAYRLYRRTK